MDLRESDSPQRHKRSASVASSSFASAQDSLKRFRPHSDVVLVSRDGNRFHCSSRLLASSPDILPPNQSASDVTHTASNELESECHMPESGRTLGILLEYFEPTPVQPRVLDFPNDWELMAALKRYSVWRGIDAMHAVLNQSPLPPNLVAPAFIFSQLFTIPTLVQLAAKAAAKSCTSDADALDALLAGLTCGAEETGLQQEKVMPLITYLLRRSTYLHTLRSRALATLRAFDDEYECEDSCRGMVYSSLSDILSTTSRRRLRKLDYGAGEVDFACKDCDVRWEKVVTVLLEGVADMPEPPVFC